MTFRYDETGPAIFENLTAEIPLGRNIFLNGSVGGGLSTFLKLLGVLVQPQQGSVFINQYDSTQMTFEDFLYIRMKMGYSFDFGGLFANRTLHENLTLPLLYHKICSPERASEMAHELAAHFGFEKQENQRPAMVSGGLRKLTCVLRAFVMKPQMALLDDPFTGVGMDAARKLVRMIQERREVGELKHLFITSRDDVWPHWLGCDLLHITPTSAQLEERQAA
jgi:ABC-type transporter Mla maintaining outer membrane lipid asymmetry ATPase subunit MlaF